LAAVKGGSPQTCRFDLARPRDVVSAPFNEMRRELARLLDHQ
jgi:hypothetical protein